MTSIQDTVETRTTSSKSPTAQYPLRESSAPTSHTTETDQLSRIRNMSFDPLIASASELASLLARGQLTSSDIVRTYLYQIELHNAHLKALISVTPPSVALAMASGLDSERAAGNLRSPLHGIPIIVKDNISTGPDLGMTTTLGAIALEHAMAPKNAVIIERLLDAGMIVIGKANLTIMCGLQSSAGNRPGYSSVAGQTQSPFIFPFGLDQDDASVLPHSSPGGSSAVSAMSLGAGFAPMSLGTETVGSIVTPANRAGLYALKPTPGLMDTAGVWRLSDSFDSVGPMARTVKDLRSLGAVLLCDETLRPRGDDMGAKSDQEILELRVGFADPRKWTLAEEVCTPINEASEQMIEDYEAAVDRLRKRALTRAKVLYPVEIPRIYNELKYEAEEAPKAMTGFRLIAHSETAAHVGQFLSSLILPPDQEPINSVQDLVNWNESHAEKAFSPPLKDQGELHDLIALHKNPLPSTKLAEAVAKFKRVGGSGGLDPIFAELGVDILAAPADSSFVSVGAAAGYPCCTVPVGRLRYNHRPFGLVAVATKIPDGMKSGEEALLRFMDMWERFAAPAQAVASFP